MYTILISLMISVACVILPAWVLDWSPKWTVLPAFALGVAAFVWLSRRISRRFEALNQAADRELQALQQLGQQMAQRPTMRNPLLLVQRLDAAVAIFRRGFFLEKWLFSKPQLMPDAPVGECIPYLEKALVKGRKAQLMSNLWPAWAMLGIAYYKQDKKNLARVRGVFDACLAHVRKEPLFWQIYAFVLVGEDDVDAAIAVLARAKEVLPDDAALAENLTALQNRKKMNMRPYGELWYQFGLELPKIAQPPRMPHPRARGGFARRR